MSQQLPLTFEQAAALSVDALWGLADEELLRVLVEDRRIERKPVGIRADQLAEYFSMWGNTGPEGGLIAVGISDRGLPLGCLTMEVRHINKLEGEAHNLCPHAHVECKRVPVVRASDAHADFALLFRVHYNDSRVVTTVKGDAFIRRGEYKHRLTAEEIRDLQNDKREVSVEQELCPQYVFPDDFDQSLIDDWATTVRLNLTEPITTERLLVARYLGRLKDGQFVPNAACVLVFATNPRLMFQGAKIQLMRFEGEKEGTGKDWNAVKHAFVEGPIPRMIQAAATFLDSQLREFSKLGPDGRFYSAPEYPREAWYEALVNACVHRSYGSLKNMTIFVKMFDNRLEIESPGAFPPGVTSENIYESSHPRNPFVMESMWFLRFVKQAGEGTRRMLKLMEESELPRPEFRQKEADYPVVRVVLRNNIKQREAWIDSAVSGIISEETYSTLDEQEKRVINHLAEHGTVNTTQAVRLTGKGWKAAHKLLLRLQAKGLVSHIHRQDVERDPAAFFILNRRAMGGHAEQDGGST